MLTGDLQELFYQKSKNNLDMVSYAVSIIENTKDIVCCYKINLAFWLQEKNGLAELMRLFEYIKENSLDAVTILDGKFGDVENTNRYYSSFVFDVLGADAVTLNPYVGLKALIPFFERKDKGSFVLCSTSNEGSGEFQEYSSTDPLYKKVAQEVGNGEFSKNNNLGLVMGATNIDRIKYVRKVMDIKVPFLIPGVGTQGGNLKCAASQSATNNNEGFIISSSRALLEPSNSDESVDGYYEGLRSRVYDLQFNIDSVLYGLI